MYYNLRFYRHEKAVSVSAHRDTRRRRSSVQISD